MLTISPNVQIFSSLFEVLILKDAILPQISNDLLEGREVA
jgi:hypothetical protein